MKKKSRKKSLIIILISIFIAFNILWFINYTFKYGKFTEKVEYNYGSSSYHETDKEKGATFTVVPPSYPFFAGNMYIDYDDKDCDLYINPKLILGYEIGFLYSDDEGNLLAEIWFDEDMNLIDKYESIGTIEEYSEEINELCDLAYEKWGILIYDKE